MSDADKTASQRRMEEESEFLRKMYVIKNRDDYTYIDKKIKDNFIFKYDPMTFSDKNPDVDKWMEEILTTKAKDLTDVLAGATVAKSSLPPGKVVFDPKKKIDFANIPNIFDDLFSDPSNPPNITLSGTIPPVVWNSNTGGFNDIVSTLPPHQYVTIELPLYIGQNKAGEMMDVIQHVYDHHGDDDTGSLYKVQDALDGFVKAHFQHIRAGNDHGPATTEFDFHLCLPTENHANLLSSWPRNTNAFSMVGSFTQIKVTARISSMFFVGYDVDDKITDTPLRMRLQVKVQRGLDTRVTHVLYPLLRDNCVFFVVGAADVDDFQRVNLFEVQSVFIHDTGNGSNQVLLK